MSRSRWEHCPAHGKSDICEARQFERSGDLSHALLSCVLMRCFRSIVQQTFEKPDPSLMNPRASSQALLVLEACCIYTEKHSLSF